MFTSVGTIRAASRDHSSYGFNFLARLPCFKLYPRLYSLVALYIILYQ